MTMSELVSRPSEEQLRSFRALSMAERYAWLTSVLRTTHRLATDETRAKWRARKQAQGGFVASALALVRALDGADFEAAVAAIHSSAVYVKGEETICGAATIIASYRASHERAVATLDRIVYRSSFEVIAPGTVRVRFEDHIEVGTRTHRYRCEQDMTVGRSKRVERIVHRELEGERAALDAFLAATRGSAAT